MISVLEAWEKISGNTSVSKPKSIHVSVATGHVTAEDIHSPLDLPPFHQSAMDGFAFRINDFEEGKQIRIIGESSAGENFSRKIKISEAVRIFTGAIVPQGSDTVVIQEKAEVEGKSLIIRDEKIFQGANIRQRGHQVKKSELAISRGTFITPATVGFLASMGISKIKVHQKPKVSVIVTGDELQVAGPKLAPGKIYESNSATLISALQVEGISSIRTLIVDDNEKKIRNAFRKAMLTSDFILCTGGISTGDYDFVGSMLKKEKVKEIFYKVRQKPGKPFYFGVKGKKYVFGLPGNPASVLTCFYEFVIPALRKFSGNSEVFLRSINLPLQNSFRKKPGMANFLKAYTDLKSVTILPGQESFIMKSFSEANCLVFLPEETEVISENEIVRVDLLP